MLELDEVAAHPQIAARGLISETAAGLEVRPAVEIRKDWRRRDAPGQGEHNAEVLAEVGVDTADLEELRRQGVV